MKRGPTGTYAISAIGGEKVRAFIPKPLPPDPPLALQGPIQTLLERALLALGRLDSVSTLLSGTDLFLYAYVRKEAVFSSQIEGTQSSLSDLLLFEMEQTPGAPLDDVVEVSSYVAAMEHGLARLRGGFPLSSRLIREIHAKLLSRGRGSSKDPGEFRRSQNWIGGSRPGTALFVPPPPTAGRFFISLYFKQHRADYYRLLDEVRKEGGWEEWLEFFLQGILETSEAAVATCRRLVALSENDRKRIQPRGRPAGSALRVHEALKQRPVAVMADIARRAGLSFRAVSSGMKILDDLGISRELTGRKRNRVFVYDAYLKILNEGTEP
jgi:Fic family protein